MREKTDWEDDREDCDFFLLLRSRGWGLGGTGNAAQSGVSVADRTVAQAT